MSVFSPAISYNNPSAYTQSGDQTHINNSTFLDGIKEKFGNKEDSIQQLTKVRRWLKDSFLYESNRGATIGTATVDELYVSKIWHGCHDLAHLFAATVRNIGYPCTLVETTSVAWSKKYVANPQTTEDVQGHNLTEVYVQGKWILFDPMSPLLIENYDPLNPLIPSSQFYADEPEGFYVIAKGKDCWDYGIRSLEDLLQLQKATALSCTKY